MQYLFAATLQKARSISSQWKLREPVSGLTHCIGIVLALIGLVLLISEAAYPTKPWHLAAFTIYGISMILLYTVSTIFHWFPMEDDETSGLRKLDHIMIFIFIAACCTPFCLIPLRDACGWKVFGCIWALAAVGSVSKIFWIRTPSWVTSLIYVLVGLIGFVCIFPITHTLQGGALFWIMAGGILYCIGAFIYAVERPDPLPNLIGFHEIFHVFVMLGSTAHFWVMYKYIAVFD